MKILLLGKGGQVGWELQRALAPLGEAGGLRLRQPWRLAADFTQPESLRPLCGAVRPD
jgi:dTDP-4-dehydrorhamnose reductase